MAGPITRPSLIELVYHISNTGIDTYSGLKSLDWQEFQTLVETHGKFQQRKTTTDASNARRGRAFSRQVNR